MFGISHLMKLELLPVWLVVLPMIAGAGMLVLRNRRWLSGFVIVSSGVIGLLSLGLLLPNFARGAMFLGLESHWVNGAILFTEIVLAVFILTVGIRSRHHLISILILLQAGALVWFEFVFRHSLSVANNFFIDSFSVIMGLIIGMIGSLIAVYSVGYMKSYHTEHHPGVRDRRPYFFFVFFIFLSAMFGVVFANNLLWLYFFWEITTICSFLLIEYKGDAEARRNALRALFYNLIGGVCFVLAILITYFNTGTVELEKLLAAQKAVALLPAVLLGFAGLTKSAQMPFSSWLIGAMVAPTPVSALLHSSTMVKAGVYLCTRLAVILEGTLAGLMIALIGAFTFLATALIAVRESDAKKVLAYSTISNLGLIVMCAGIGTYEAVWAAVLLIIFHAVAKGLLFLCAGVIENKIHSRDIEQMTGLIVTLPKLSIMAEIGIAGMFLAPFGMLISKWAVLKAIVDSNPLLVIFLVFGSAATLFFWVKWIGRLICVLGSEENREEGIGLTEWLPLAGMSLMTLGVCAFFPALAGLLIEPFIRQMYSATVDMGQGNLIIMTILLAMVMLFPLSFINRGKKVKVVDAYLAGANTPKGTAFINSFGAASEMEMGSMYLRSYVNERFLIRSGAAVTLALMLLALLALPR